MIFNEIGTSSLGKPMTNPNSTNHIIRLVVTIFVVAAIAIGAYFTTAFADDPGYALSFDGIRQYVRLGNTSTVMGNSAWIETKSVTLWVKVTGNSPPTSLSGGEIILSTDNPQLFGMVRAISSGRDRLWVWNGDANGPDFVGVDFTPGEWMHLAVVHQGGVLSVYKNGVLAGSVASGPTYIPYAVYVGVLYLGGSGRSGTSTYYDGQIDEVAFWDIALDLPSITGLMNSVITDAHPLWNHLKAYYRMSDRAGMSLSDDSAYSNTGSLLGGMSDANWVLSGAFGGGQVTMTPTGTFASTSTFTATPTGLPATSTATRTLTSTPTIMPATVTSTYTSQPASATPSLTNTPFQPSPTASSTASPTVTSTPGASEGSLIEVGFCALPSDSYDIAVVNDIAYLPNKDLGLRVVNVADPTHPVEVGFYNTRGLATGVAVQGGYAYVTDALSGLRILDVSNPVSPIEVGYYDTAGYAWDLAVRAGYAFVADRGDGLRIIDISNPMSPFEVASVLTSDEALDVALSGDYAYIAAYTKGLYVVNISNPLVPVTISVFDTDRAYGVRISGNYAYIADGGSGLRIVDVTNPVTPVQVGRYNTPGWARSLRLITDRAYVADWLAGIAIVNIADPSRPTLITQYQTPGMVRDVEVIGSYIYAADYDYGLRVLTWR